MIKTRLMSGFFILYKALAACCNRRPYCKQNKKAHILRKIHRIGCAL